MVKAHLPVPHLAVRPFHPHVPAAEDGGGHGYEGCEDGQVDVEGIDEEELSPGDHWAMQIDLHCQGDARSKSCGGAGDVDLGGVFPVPHEGEDNGEKYRYAEKNEKRHEFT